MATDHYSSKSWVCNMIETCVSQHRQYYNESNQLHKIIGLTNGTGIFNTVGRILDSYVDAIDSQFIHSENLLSWYIYDNDCGEGGLKISVNGESFKVDTIDKLVDLMFDQQNDTH